MIVVTGANGKLGNAIVRKLAARISTDQICATCRNPEKASDLEALGVRVRVGDFADPDSLSRAFVGASQVLMVSSNVGAQGGDPVSQHNTAIMAAKSAGAKRIIYTSHMAASASSAFPPMRDHAATEQILQQADIAWTALRNGFYGLSGIAMMDEAVTTGMIKTAQNGKFSWVAHDDLADAAAIILTQETPIDGPTEPLTGPESLDFGELATILAQVLGKHVEHQTITDDEMRAKIVARGAPVRALEAVMGLFIAARNGEFAHVSTALEHILGRPRISMRELMLREMTSSRV
jgi:NAD(P)H dehydrogenase (quinone)